MQKLIRIDWILIRFIKKKNWALIKNKWVGKTNNQNAVTVITERKYTIIRHAQLRSRNKIELVKIRNFR